MSRHRERTLPQDHLQRPVLEGLREGRSQHRVPVDQALPGAVEGVEVEQSAQAEGQLHPMCVGARTAFGVLDQLAEEQTFLERRQGVDVSDVLALDHVDGPATRRSTRFMRGGRARSPLKTTHRGHRPTDKEAGWPGTARGVLAGPLT
jgi:hypothetical protein